MFRCIQGGLPSDHSQRHWDSWACQHWPPRNQRFVFVFIHTPFRTSASKPRFCLYSPVQPLEPPGVLVWPCTDARCWLFMHDMLVWVQLAQLSFVLDLPWLSYTHLFSPNRSPQQCIMLWLDQLTVIFSHPMRQIWPCLHIFLLVLPDILPAVCTIH